MVQVIYGGNIHHFTSKLQKNQTKKQIASYLGWIPALGGILGTVVGGVVADLVVMKFGIWARLGVVIASNLAAAPFAFMSLMTPVPWTYFALIPGYMASEMWLSVTLVVITEMAPIELRATVVSVYIFFISIIGGNMTFLVEPVERLLKSNLEKSLMVLFPGMYILSAILFSISMIILRKKTKTKKKEQMINLRERID